MIGTRIGKYQILAVLGRGATGIVYRALDDTLDREVAIKVLNPHFAAGAAMKRFRAEAAILAKLSHPEIATIHELLGTETGLLMVMELVRGETLENLASRLGAISPDLAGRLLDGILSALEHAHRSGIVHRDLKPANVMVTQLGGIKIMDFGIARVRGTEHMTIDGAAVGTPAYMAPEQILGEEIDGRADLYAVGVIFYRLLAGVLPFAAASPMLMLQKQISEAPPPLHLHRQGLPEWCEAVVQRALAKLPADRFQTAQEFRTTIARAMGLAPSIELAKALAITGNDVAAASPEQPPLETLEVTRTLGQPPDEQTRSATSNRQPPQYEPTLEVTATLTAQLPPRVPEALARGTSSAGTGPAQDGTATGTSASSRLQPLLSQAATMAAQLPAQVQTVVTRARELAAARARTATDSATDAGAANTASLSSLSTLTMRLPAPVKTGVERATGFAGTRRGAAFVAAGLAALLIGVYLSMDPASGSAEADASRALKRGASEAGWELVKPTKETPPAAPADVGDEDEKVAEAEPPRAASRVVAPLAYRTKVVRAPGVEEDGVLSLGDDRVSVSSSGANGKPVFSARYKDISAVYHWRESGWKPPKKLSKIIRVDDDVLDALGVRDRHHLSLHTKDKNRLVVLRIDERVVNTVIQELRQRTGRKAERRN